MNEKRTFTVVTLGCKLNYAESATIARELTLKGYQRVGASAGAGITIINTCSVTEHADKKSRQAIRKALRINPETRVIVTGCSAQLRAGSLAGIPGVGAILGTDFRDRVAQVAADPVYRAPLTGPGGAGKVFFPAWSAGEDHRDRTRSFLKVQDGCDYCCTYCTVPLARGRSRNIPIAQVVQQAQEIAARGVKEIVLTGVNTGDFGKTTGESFAGLLRELSLVKGIERYRISSIEPNLLTEEIIEMTASMKCFLPHFHIPLQSGSSRILRKMGRRYDPGLFARKVRFIRSLMPYAFIGVDVIAGFPGETEADFMETYKLLEDLEPSYLHIFPFSPRPGTPAALLPVSERVREGIITERTRMLGQLSDRLHREFIQANRGRKEEVLFEGKTGSGKMHGYTRNYIRVERPYDRSLINTVVEIILD
ncbi:MAG TPA: tRNA (N(6)-L-threonylcarbamoyladenosine(37)-C(2))-methylthiotransferase MtaB [Bacteroidales bacterium]|jgi:threonylcarbamoyladenosine tRNA methylthiotransferase MtaB|nr:tRNA (N(6)-L-threonylcarbamoyladenosine(37)-C(2))-methylthiotransferase MtaB [Bacteroidales bacterium]